MKQKIRRWVWRVSGAQAELDKQERQINLLTEALVEAWALARKELRKQHTSAHITEEGMEYRVREPYRPKN